MTDWVRWAVIGAGVLLGIVGYLQFRRNRQPGRYDVGLALLVEAVVLLMAVLSVIGLLGGHRPAELATFLGYLATAVLLVPAGLYFGRFEPSRWSSLVLAVTGLTVAVLAVRLDHLWAA